ncbi:hypothetical protein EV122DRAFT_293518 [Schizophyllum commune]
MARRSAPPNSGPAYIGRIPAAGGPADDGNAFTNFIREELQHGINMGAKRAMTFLVVLLRLPQYMGPLQSRTLTHTQITSPEKIAGNLSILTGVTVFLAGIFAVRTWGENMIPHYSHWTLLGTNRERLQSSADNVCVSRSWKVIPAHRLPDQSYCHHHSL